MNLWAAVRSRFTISRTVALLTPLVVAPLVGWLTTRLAELGFEPDSGQMTAIFIAGLTAAVTAMYKWLDGRAKWEAATELPAGIPPEMSLSLPDDIAVTDDLADEELEEVEIDEEIETVPPDELPIGEPPEEASPDAEPLPRKPTGDRSA